MAELEPCLETLWNQVISDMFMRVHGRTRASLEGRVWHWARHGVASVVEDGICLVLHEVIRG